MFSKINYNKVKLVEDLEALADTAKQRTLPEIIVKSMNNCTKKHINNNNN